MKILMVCLGNICRSPMAEGMLRQKVKQQQLNVTVDSAGFVAAHRGESPDRRAAVTMEKHGYSIREIRSRLFSEKDFDSFDRIYVMDENNYDDVMAVARHNQDKQKVDFLMNEALPHQNIAIADPYYGGINGFENTFNMLDQATDAIVEKLKQKA